MGWDIVPGLVSGGGHPVPWLPLPNFLLDRNSRLWLPADNVVVLLLQGRTLQVGPVWCLWAQDSGEGIESSSRGSEAVC